MQQVEFLAVLGRLGQGNWSLPPERHPGHLAQGNGGWRVRKWPRVLNPMAGATFTGCASGKCARTQNTGALCPTVHNRRRSSVEISSNQIAPFLGVEASLPVESTKSQNITGDVSRGALDQGHPDAAGRHAMADGPRLIGAVNPVQRVLVALP